MPVQPLPLGPILAFLIAASITSMAAKMLMIRRINEVVPADQQQFYFNRWSMAYRRRFRELFPGDRLLLWHDVSYVCMFVGVAVVFLFPLVK